MPIEETKKLEEGFDTYILEKRRRSFANIFILGFTINPAFFILDLYVGEASSWIFFVSRFISTLLCIGLFIISKKFPDKINLVDQYGLVPIVLVSVHIALVMHFTGGYQSPYWAGLLMMALIIGLYLFLTTREAFSLTLLNTALYILASFTSSITVDLPVFFTYSSVLFAMCLITGYAVSARLALEKDSYVANRRVEAANEELKQLDKAKSNFLANISHELKTPMTLIVNPIEEAIQRRQGSEITIPAQDAELVRRNTYRLSTLISDLIELSRGDIGKTQLSPTEIHDVRYHFQNLFDTIEPLFHEKKIKAEVKVEGELLPHLFDVRKIDKVFYNLLGNALKFTPEGGQITALLRDLPNPEITDEPVLEITVTDSGIGIPLDKLPHIFDRFVQVEEGSTRKHEGMGLGLSMVKDFVEQHGGKASVTSQEGKGSAFTIRLPRGRQHFTVPVVDSDGMQPVSEQKLDFTQSVLRSKRRTITEEQERQENESPEAEDKISEIHEGQKTVLVVDDNPDLRHSIRTTLSDDYNIVTAVDGQDGLKRARDLMPDMILSDIMMPNMDGYQMVKAIRADDLLKETPVILLTAKTGEEGLTLGFQSGANDYLTKPFSANELKLRIKNHLLIRELQAEMIHQQNLVSVGTLSAGISHNMNTYAATIDAGLDLVRSRLKKMDAGPDVERRLGSGLRSAEDGLQSIRHMIETLEIYSQKNIEGFKDDNIAVTCRSVVDLAQAKMPTNVTLEFEGPEELMGHFNPHLLNPAILNLIDNAADACEGRNDSIIKLFVSEADDDIIIRVSDNGPGIPKEVQGRIWDAYFTTKDVDQGTGLGLWMVRRAVEIDHGGKVWFESNEQGTTFFIRLPKQARTVNEGAQQVTGGSDEPSQEAHSAH